jgi:hypothetical protein
MRSMILGILLLTADVAHAETGDKGYFTLGLGATSCGQFIAVIGNAPREVRRCIRDVRVMARGICVGLQRHAVRPVDAQLVRQEPDEDGRRRCRCPHQRDERGAVAGKRILTPLCVRLSKLGWVAAFSFDSPSRRALLRTMVQLAVA